MRRTMRVGLVGYLAAATASVAFATDLPAYSPVQTEDEIRFVSQTLGLADRIAALQSKLGRPLRIEYALLDLDGDGKGEIFVRLVGDEACTPGQCQVMVYEQVQEHWTKVLESADPAVSVAKQTHRGYRDILVGARPWSWTGKAYSPMR